jgi:predicted translin family RNA/ssDNA-binding protein
MYDQQQQRINRAAQEFTEALVAAYKTTSESTAVAQELGARQIEYFFDAVIGNLRAQAGGTSQMARQLAGQQRLAQETTRDLARVSTDNYMDLLDSVFSFYQGGASRTQRRADEARGHIEEAEARAEQAETRAEQAEARAGEAERARSEAESRGGDEEGDTEADAASQPQSQWVRTSGRSKVRGRDTRARNRSSGRRR